jgi:hypothetical protein
MPVYLGTTNYIGSTGTPTFPLPAGGNANPGPLTPGAAAGTYTQGGYLMAGTSGQAFWAYPGNPTSVLGGTFSTRSIFTHGYLAGGYKNSNPWRTVNKTWHATDTTYSLGEQLDRPFTYGGGTFSDYNGYVHGCCEVAVTSVLGNFTTANLSTVHSSSYNLQTGLARTVSSQGGVGINNTSNIGYVGPEGSTGLISGVGATYQYTGNNPSADGSGLAYGTGSVILGVGNIEMTTARSYHAGAVDQTGQMGWIAGGQTANSVTDRLAFATEIMYVGPSATPISTAVSTVAAHGQTVGWWSFQNSKYQLPWATGSWTAWSTPQSWATDGQSKFLSTKLGYHYGGTGANVTTGFGSWSDSTGSVITNSLSKPAAVGEEAYEMGQNWGYALGTYNGQQNNYSFKVIYATGTMYVAGDALNPKGHGGTDAGVCSSAAATVTAGAM